jgi:TonB family protein
MRTPRIVLTFVAIIGITPLVNAQYVRISNTEGIAPNGGMSPPTVLKSTLALYTDDARAHGVEGTVTVEAVIGEDGRIIRTRVLKGLGFGLDEVSLASVQQWTFSPATQNGMPVSIVAQIDVPFSLASANAVRMEPGMKPPSVQYRVESQYTDAARRARYQGTVVVQLLIKKDGTANVMRVIQGLGLGLTDSAMDALKQWKFSPAQKDGKDVDVAINVEVNFNLK